MAELDPPEFEGDVVADCGVKGGSCFIAAKPLLRVRPAWTTDLREAARWPSEESAVSWINERWPDFWAGHPVLRAQFRFPRKPAAHAAPESLARCLPSLVGLDGLEPWDAGTLARDVLHRFGVVDHVETYAAAVLVMTLVDHDSAPAEVLELAGDANARMLAALTDADRDAFAAWVATYVPSQRERTEVKAELGARVLNRRARRVRHARRVAAGVGECEACPFCGKREFDEIHAGAHPTCRYFLEHAADIEGTDA